MRIINLLVLVSFLSLVAPADARGEAPPPANGTLQPNVPASPSCLLEITEEAPAFVAAISPLPITRVRLSIDKTDGTEHHEIEWDPALPGPRLRKLSPSNGCYELAVWVQPLSLYRRSGATKQDMVYVTYPMSDFSSVNGKLVSNGQATDALANAITIDTITSSKPAKKTTVTTQPDKLDLPKLSVSIQLMLRSGTNAVVETKLRVNARQESISLRGLSDPVPQGVGQVLELITQIAMDRAENRGFALLKKKTVNRLCKEFIWGKFEIGVKDNKLKVLPATCALIDSMRLRDLASSGKALITALRTDMGQSVLPVLTEVTLSKVIPKKHAAILQPLLVRVTRLALSVAGSSPTSARDAQLLLAEIPHIAWQELERRTGYTPDTILALRTVLSGGEIDATALLGIRRSDAINKLWLQLIESLSKQQRQALQHAHSELSPYLTYNSIDQVLGQLDVAVSADSRKALLPIALKAWDNMNETDKTALTYKIASVILQESKLLTQITDTIAAHPGLPTKLKNLLKKATDQTRADTLVKVVVEARGILEQTILRDAGPVIACGVQLIVAIANECVSRDGCSASEVSNMVADSARYFWTGAKSSELSVACFAKDGDMSKALRHSWPTLDLLAERAVFMVQPPASATPTDLAYAGLDLVFELLEQLNKKCVGCENADLPLKSLRTLLDAVIDKDTTRAISAASQLIASDFPKGDDNDSTESRNEKSKALNHAMQLLAAFSAYSSVDASDPEAAKEARKAQRLAIESLIDTFTDRSARGGEFVVSFGANPGFNLYGRQKLYGPDRAVSTEKGRVELPVGFALQWLPGHMCLEDNKWIEWLKYFGCRNVGLHFMASAADLGQYIPSTADTTIRTADGNVSDQAETDVSWYDLVSLRGQFGFMLGNPSDSLIVGVQASWAPSLFERTVDNKKQSGVFRFGIFASYYVPFLDLN